MSEYLFNCAKCTNISVNNNGVYCRPMTEGKKACYIKDGESGKDFVFVCDYYTEEPMQITFNINESKRKE